MLESSPHGFNVPHPFLSDSDPLGVEMMSRRRISQGDFHERGFGRGQLADAPREQAGAMHEVALQLTEGHKAVRVVVQIVPVQFPGSVKRHQEVGFLHRKAGTGHHQLDAVEQIAARGENAGDDLGRVQRAWALVFRHAGAR